MKAFIVTIIVMLMAYFGVELSDLKEEQSFGGALTTDQKITEIQTEVETLETGKSKYQQVPLTTNENGLKYEVHEYQTSKGETGYQIFYYENGRLIKSVGYGVEAASRTYTPTYYEGTASTTPL